MKEELEAKSRVLLQDLTIQACGTAFVAPSSKGMHLSMLPASSKRRKTHGTQHY
jgi:hypothetical protein